MHHATAASTTPRAKAPRVSRMQALRDAGSEPPLPPLGHEGYLIGYLMDAGPVQAGGMGPQPLGWSEMACWQQQTGLRLHPWELRTVRNLSREYAAMANSATQPDCPAPYSTAPTLSQREHVANRIRTIFGGRAAQSRSASKKATH